MNTLSYTEQIEKEIRKARKAKNSLAMNYYTEALSKSACVSFETFSKSWAGQLWLAKHRG